MLKDEAYCCVSCPLALKSDLDGKAAGWGWQRVWGWGSQRGSNNDGNSNGKNGSDGQAQQNGIGSG